MAKKLKVTVRGLKKELESVREFSKKYRQTVFAYITTLRNPESRTAFSVTGYTNDKKPNSASVPELIAIVGTAKGLGYSVKMTISGVDNGATLNFTYVKDAPAIPSELY